MPSTNDSTPVTELVTVIIRYASAPHGTRTDLMAVFVAIAQVVQWFVGEYCNTGIARTLNDMPWTPTSDGGKFHVMVDDWHHAMADTAITANDTANVFIASSNSPRALHRFMFGTSSLVYFRGGTGRNHVALALSNLLTYQYPQCPNAHDYHAQGKDRVSAK